MLINKCYNYYISTKANPDGRAQERMVVMNGTVVEERAGPIAGITEYEWRGHPAAAYWSPQGVFQGMLIQDVGPFLVHVSVEAAGSPCSHITVQDERMNEATEEAYTTYEREELAHLFMSDKRTEREEAAVIGMIGLVEFQMSRNEQGIGPRRG